MNTWRLRSLLVHLHPAMVSVVVSMTSDWGILGQQLDKLTAEPRAGCFWIRTQECLGLYSKRQESSLDAGRVFLRFTFNIWCFLKCLVIRIRIWNYTLLLVTFHKKENLGMFSCHPQKEKKKKLKKYSVRNAPG